ncbi:MAG: hypothetical protein IJY93_06685 [Clostridia bacterium]|nr:hypothetical protein [Clostridia bacterium]
MDDMDYYEWEESKKRFTPGKIIKFFFKLIAAIVIIGTFVLIIGRGQLMKIPKAFTGITWTESIVDAYNKGELDAVYQTPHESFDTKGYYHISDVVLSKSTNEVQLTVRYNKRSTINTLMDYYSLTERPTGEVFIYILSDDSGNTYTDYTVAASSNNLYEFRRVIFSGVDLETTEGLYLDIFYGGHVSTESKMYASFVAYDGEMQVIHHTPSEDLDEDDFYRLSGFNLSKGAGTVGLTLRYNSENIKNTLCEKYGLSSLPEDVELFTYTLTDDNGNVYEDYSISASSEDAYEFRNLSFSGVDLTGTETLYLTVYCSEEVNPDTQTEAGFKMYIGIPNNEELTFKKAGSTKLVFSDAPDYISELE